MTPLADEPPVLAVEVDKIHEEFDRRCPLNEGDREKQLNKRRQVFKRSRTVAIAKGLIGCRDIEGKFMIWAMNPEDAALDAKSPHSGHG